MTWLKFNQILTIVIICHYLYQSGHDSYLSKVTKVGLGWSEVARCSSALFIYAVMPYSHETFLGTILR